MGFFKSISLDTRAESLAANFAKLRQEQFSCILDNLERVLSEEVVPSKRILGGEADLALKGYQMWILIMFLSTRGYVAAKDVTMFTGMVMRRTHNLEERDAVTDYCVTFDKTREPPAQVVQVAVPIARYLLGGVKDPCILSAMGATLAIFLLQVEFFIASEFRDKDTMAKLQVDMEFMCNGLGSS